jgi:hypothetical protein
VPLLKRHVLSYYYYAQTSKQTKTIHVHDKPEKKYY